MQAAPKNYILANLINEKIETRGSLNVLTFVEINNFGEFVEERRTYNELWQNGHRVAKALLEEKMSAGSSFAIVSQNHPEFVDTMVGSSILGTIFVPIDPRTKGQKLSFMLNHAECEGAIVGDYAVENIKEIFIKHRTQ